MTDHQITTAFQKLLHLHSAAGEAIAQFAAAGAIRQVIFRPGSEIFAAYECGARELQDALNPLGDPRATALVDEILSLANRMIRLEASLPPARPYNRHLKTRQAGSSASKPTALGVDELNLAGIALYLGTGTLWNYLGATLSRPDLQGKTRYVLCQPELAKWCKWSGCTDADAIDTIVDRVTRHLAALCV